MNLKISPSSTSFNNVSDSAAVKGSIPYLRACLQCNAAFEAAVSFVSAEKKDKM